MNEQHRGIGEKELIFVHIKFRQPRGSSNPFGYSAVMSHPKLPPKEFRGREINFADKQRVGLCGTDGLDLLELVHICRWLIAPQLPIGANATLQKGSGIIRHKEKRAFSSVVAPL